MITHSSGDFIKFEKKLVIEHCKTDIYIYIYIYIYTRNDKDFPREGLYKNEKLILKQKKIKAVGPNCKMKT